MTHDNDTDTPGRRSSGRRIRVVVVAASLCGIAAVTTYDTASASREANQVRGVADFTDATCPGLNLEPSPTGWSLDGCLQITGFEREKFNVSGTYQEEGTERFDGDLYIDGEYAGTGSFETAYQFRGKFEEIGDFGTEIFGRCQHPIVAGTGVFANIEGRLDFKDVLDGPEAPLFPYRGHIRL